MNSLARKIREGDLRSLAQAATAVENGDARAHEILRDLEPFTGHARVVGITGPPGAGKSTLVDALAAELAGKQLDKVYAVEHELLAAGSRCPSFATHNFTGLGNDDFDNHTETGRAPIPHGTSSVTTPHCGQLTRRM